MPTAAPKAPAAPRPSQGRVRRVAKWVGLVVCVGLVFAWAGSTRWPIECWVFPRKRPAAWGLVIQVAHGGVVVDEWPISSGDPQLQSRVYFNAGLKGPIQWWFRRDWTGKLSWAFTPLWLPVAPLVLPTAALWYRDYVVNRRRRAGQCVKCGYDRAGLRDNPCCPECGAPATDRPKVSASQQRAAADTDRLPSAAHKAPAAPKAWRGRVRRVAKWAGLVVCVGVAGVSVWSRTGASWWWLSYSATGSCDARYVLVYHGALQYCSHPLAMMPEPDVMMRAYRQEREDWFPIMGWWTGASGDMLAILPLWIPFVVLAVPTGLLWHRDRTSVRRRRAGQCVKCGYDRAGLPAESPCPECGAASSGGAKAKT